MNLFEEYDDQEVTEVDNDAEDDYYEQTCEELVIIPEDDEYEREPDDDGYGVCGGSVEFVSGHHYYNGTYDCYRMTLDCDRCGTYEVECV